MISSQVDTDVLMVDTGFSANSPFKRKNLDLEIENTFKKCLGFKPNVLKFHSNFAFQIFDDEAVLDKNTDFV